MTQEEIIIKAIEELAFDLSRSFTAKNLVKFLIDSHSGLHWNKGTVASVLSRYVNNNQDTITFEKNELDARGYVYFAKPVKHTFPVAKSSSVVKQYSIETDSGDISGKFHAISQLIIDLNLPMRYSQSEDKFVNYTELHVNHLENIVCKDLEGMSKAEIKVYINSPIFNTYVSKK